jgi:hypothetical protein
LVYEYRVPRERKRVIFGIRESERARERAKRERERERAKREREREREREPRERERERESVRECERAGLMGV